MKYLKSSKAVASLTHLLNLLTIFQINYSVNMFISSAYFYEITPFESKIDSVILVSSILHIFRH